MVKKYLLWAAFAVFALLPSCKQETQEPTFDKEAVEEFVPRGETISLDLVGGTDDLRAFTYDVAEGNPKLKKLTPGSKVKVLCIFRKHNDANSTTYKELDWTVGDDGKSIRYVGKVTLANGSMRKADNGSWYMMAIIGGTQSNTTTVDASSKAKVAFSAPTLKLATNNELELDVPYILSWTTLDVKKDAYGENKALKFAPQGSILKYQVRNGMIDDYVLSKLYVGTNTFTTEGAYKLSNITDEMLLSGELPQWESEQPKPQGYYYIEKYTYPSKEGFLSTTVWPHPEIERTTEDPDNQITYCTYTLDNPQAIASATAGETLYAWVMPHSEVKTPRITVFADVQATKYQQAPMSHALPIFRSSVIPESGKFHTIHPEITSELSISAVYAHYQEPNSNRGVALPVGGVGATGPGNKPPHNLSATVLYNPTIYPIDLMDYGLTRMGYFEGDNYYNSPHADLPYFSRGVTENTDAHPNATVMPLAVALGDHNPFAGAFADWVTPLRGDYSEPEGNGSDVPSRYKLVAGSQPTLTNGKLLLQPGKCAVFLSGGFLSEWEDEKATATALGVHLQEAVRKGYCQFAVAYSDAESAYKSFTTSSYQNSPQAGTLDVGTGQGMLLMRRHRHMVTEEVGYRFVDNSMPYKPSYLSPDTQYRLDLEYFYNQMMVQGELATEYAYLTRRQRGSYHPIGHPTQFISDVNNYTKLWTSRVGDASEVYKVLCTLGGEDIYSAPPFQAPKVAPWLSQGGKPRWVERT